MKPLFTPFLAGLLALVIVAVHPAKSQTASDSLPALTHYDVTLEPDFGGNSVTLLVTTRLKNLSAVPKNDALFSVGSTGEAEAMITRLGRITSGPSEEPVELTYTLEKRDGTPAQPEERPLFRVHFPRTLDPDEETELTWEYRIDGRNADSGLPLRRGEKPELYFLSDFQWLPSVYLPSKPQQFPNAHRPEWILHLRYPTGYVAAVDGIPVERKDEHGMVNETWKQRIGQAPNVFIGTYDVTVGTRDDFTIEIYTPRGCELKQHAPETIEFVGDVLSVYADLYGYPTDRIYRMVVPYTQEGAHGPFMLQVIDSTYFQLHAYDTIAHETAHTWWGGILSSHGDGSKFLREGMSNFSAALALQKVRGEQEYLDFLRELKATTFCYYPSQSIKGIKSPLIIQEGFDPRMVAFFNYRKGPLAMNALRAELGDSLFFTALKTFTIQYADRNVTMTDLMETFNGETKRDLSSSFKNLWWNPGYPEYLVETFQSEPVGSRFQTTLTIRNAGEYGIDCPVRLKTAKGDVNVSVKVEGGQVQTFAYPTDARVEEVVVDPEQITLQYTPDQWMRIWMALGDELFQLKNWNYYNKAYAHYMAGDYRTAIDVMERYFSRVSAYNGLRSIEEGMDNPIYASYALALGFYYSAVGDTASAERNVRRAIPFLVKSLADKNLAGMARRTGLIRDDDPGKKIAALLNELFGKCPDLTGIVEEEARKQKVNEWLTWWDSEGKSISLNIAVLGNYTPVRPE